MYISILVATACTEDMGVNNPQFNETSMKDYEYQALFSKVHKGTLRRIRRMKKILLNLSTISKIGSALLVAS